MKFEKIVLQAMPDTKSNFNGMNGTFYDVAEIIGRRVSLKYETENGAGDPVNRIIDFSLSEIKEFKDK